MTAYEKVTRNMVTNLSNDFKDFRAEIRKEFSDMKDINNDLYNHLSKRLPPWAAGLGAIIVALLSGFVGVWVGRF